VTAVLWLWLWLHDPTIVVWGVAGIVMVAGITWVSLAMDHRNVRQLTRVELGLGIGLLVFGCVLIVPPVIASSDPQGLGIGFAGTCIVTGALLGGDGMDVHLDRFVAAHRAEFAVADNSPGCAGMIASLVLPCDLSMRERAANRMGSCVRRKSGM
jgi:hypothetical protein